MTPGGEERKKHHTFPTAASPRSTSFTLLLGFGAAPVESAILLLGAPVFLFLFFFFPLLALLEVLFERKGSKPV